MPIKNKVSLFTYQECSDTAATALCRYIRAHGPYYEDAAKKVEALPKPTKLEDVQKILREVKLPDDGERWSGSHKPTCDLCKEQHDWVMVIHDALEDEYPMDLYVCSNCLNELMEKKVEYLEEHLEGLKEKLGEE
jgi:DNA-directed RNA polymerase subunit M/transcription elongation factor TFIIS